MQEFKTVHYRVRPGEMGRNMTKPFSVAFLSDLHNESYGENNSRLLAAIREEAPEAIFVGGDMLISQSMPKMDAAIALMKELTKKYPVYYANGNHEQRMQLHPDRYGDYYERYSNALRACGVYLLENRSLSTEICHFPMTIWGYEIPEEYYFRWAFRKELSVKQMEEVLGTPQQGSYHILIAHNPMYFPTYTDWGADLVLSGHLHGGIIRIPGLGGIISPQLKLFPKYDRGKYKRKDKTMLVSPGLGMHTIKFRINNPKELMIIDFI